MLECIHASVARSIALARRLLLAVLLSILASLALAVAVGCRRPAQQTIAFIPQMTADDVWEPSHMGALEAVQGSRFRIYWNGPTRADDIRTQIALLDRMTSAGCRGIILAPDLPLALMMPVRKALSHGIPLVIVGSALPLPASGGLSYVVNDEQQSGQLAAQRIGQQLHGKGQVAVLGLEPGAENLLARDRSFEENLRQQFPGIVVVARRIGSSSQAQVEQFAEDTLNAYPHLNAIFALTQRATGAAYQALQDRGQSRQVLLVGSEQSYQMFYYLADGQLDSILVENTYAMGVQAARILMDAKDSHTTSTLRVVQPVLVTRENMYSPQLTPVLTHLGRER